MKFDDSVGRYEKWFERNNHILDSEIEAIEQLIPKMGQGIEVGVGSGVFASRLGIEYGIEPSKNMRLKAVERGISVTNAIAEDLPIADSTYDFAIMITVDCFLKDITQAFKEVYRILSDEGYFIIAFIDRETPLGLKYNKRKTEDEFYEHANFHSSSEIIETLKSIGFKIGEKRQTVFSLDNEPQGIKEGVGEGVFAVIKAKK